jgi:hypothetical protein
MLKATPPLLPVNALIVAAARSSKSFITTALGALPWPGLRLH